MSAQFFLHSNLKEIKFNIVFFVLSDQDGDLVGHMSSQEKKNICNPVDVHVRFKLYETWPKYNVTLSLTNRFSQSTGTVLYKGSTVIWVKWL